MNRIRLSTVVGSGRLTQYVDLDLVEMAASGLATCNRQSDSHLTMRFDEGDTVVTLHRTGKYSIRNANSDEQLETANQRLLSFLQRDVDDDIEELNAMTVDNRVWLAELDGAVDLETIDERFGDNAVHPNRKGAAVVCRFPEKQVVAFVPRDGPITISGTVDETTAEATVDAIRSTIE